MTEINIIKIDAQPLEKLIDVISKGIGKLYKPKEIRKEADARAYEIKVIGRAKATALAKSKDIDQDIIDRIEERELHRQLRKQKNLDSINYIAAEQLKQEHTISGEPVDEDWINRFFNIAEDVTNEKMQVLWGRILAGEVKRPKSYSLRTLEFLKNLTKHEADLFSKVGKLKLFSIDRNMIFNPDRGKFLEEKYGITYTDILTLQDLGLFSADVSSFGFSSGDKGTQITILYGDKAIIIERTEKGSKLSINCILFTQVGMELLKLIDSVYNEEYVKKIAECFENKDKNLTFKVGDIIHTSTSGQVTVQNLKEIKTAANNV